MSVSISEESIPYYPCNDAMNPVCRTFVNKGKCEKNLECRFYHPAEITPVIIKKATRTPGFCFCGSKQKCIINGRAYKLGSSRDNPTFFVVCGRTGRSMKRCI